MLPNLFATKIVLLAKKVVLADYISSSPGNWETKKCRFNIEIDSDNATEGKGNNNTVEKEEKDLKNKINVNN